MSSGLRPPSAGSGAHGGQSGSRPVSAASRTPEIFRKNGVGPAPVEAQPLPGPSTKGSVASLQSKGKSHDSFVSGVFVDYRRTVLIIMDVPKM